VCLARDEEYLIHVGFPMALSNKLWMLVPYSETDPVWQKVDWDDSISVEGALCLTFKTDDLVF
jgi:hypothetical protein